MDQATIALTVLSGSILVVFLSLFIWGLRTGQFKNIEEPKYRMLERRDKSSDVKNSKEKSRCRS